MFTPVVEGYHKGFKVGEHKHVTDLDPHKIKIALSASAQKKIISTRIRVARNLGFFPLNPGGTKETRLEIAALMGKVGEARQNWTEKGMKGKNRERVWKEKVPYLHCVFLICFPRYLKSSRATLQALFSCTLV